LQNSFMLLLVVSVYKRCSSGRVTVVADCHNKSLKKRMNGPLGGLFFALKRWSFHQADLVIVSNETLLYSAAILSDHVQVLRDPLPVAVLGVAHSDIRDVPAPTDAAFTPPIDPYVLFVCSFAEDEPVESILSAAVDIDRAGYSVVITGDCSALDVPELVRSAPNVFMPGYVSTACYDRLLSRAHVVVALTRDHDCLLCAAYEAVAARRSLVVSDTAVLRACFKDLATYTVNEPASILAAVHRAAATAGDPGLTDAVTRFELDFKAEFEQLTTRLSHIGAIGMLEDPPHV